MQRHQHFVRWGDVWIPSVSLPAAGFNPIVQLGPQLMQVTSEYPRVWYLNVVAELQGNPSPNDTIDTSVDLIFGVGSALARITATDGTWNPVGGSPPPNTALGFPGLGNWFAAQTLIVVPSVTFQFDGNDRTARNLGVKLTVMAAPIALYPMLDTESA